ncbi:MAG: single-stranded-DNA-specific exonuclease RecJ, partial [Chlorobiales bacterium]|nr:single-stranded-DNA-specific exonuclease RecJ [Chlorobiales bacterium]
MKKYRWTLLTPDQSKAGHLSQEINVSLPVAKALLNRGVQTFDDAKAFFRPSREAIHSPFLLKDMQRAAERIARAIRDREPMMIYGDYDVDGTTGTAMLYLFLSEVGANAFYYINDRHKEGYGVAMSGIDHAREHGAKVIISVDCGITSVEPVHYAHNNGIDFIVCDHHEPGELPKACAILDPKVADSGYPFRELCGCGVAFKLMQALAATLQVDEERVFAYLDLVSLAIAADIVKLVDENRVLMAEGLKIIQANPRLCLRAMASVCGFDLTKTSSSQIVFGIAPRINAAGRMEHAQKAIRWLTAQTESEAYEAAMALEEVNRERREIDLQIFKEAELMAGSYANNYTSSIVLFKEEWHLGVIGIVASRVLEKFYRPTIILTAVDGNIKGSVRSVSGVNVYEALCECKAYLTQFGGHEYAAGLTMKPGQLDDFRKAFNLACEKRFDMEQRMPEIRIDAELGLEEINPKFFNVLRQFAPFGPDNPRPVFMTSDVQLAQPPRLLKD